MSKAAGDCITRGRGPTAPRTILTTGRARHEATALWCRRWWFICPRTGKQVSKLHLPPGAPIFASRQAYRLGHHSQRQTARDRSLSRAFKARQRLGNHDGIDGFIVKPKGMRWRTFDRLMAKVLAAEAVVEHHSALLVDMLRRKTGERLDL